MRRITADKRVLAAVALLGLLLAGLGAYAVFQEVLRAPIQVATGRFDFRISNAVPQDNEPQNQDIAQCNANIAQDGNSVDITISNAYPRYKCEITLTFLNRDRPDSTIPGRLEARDGPENPAPWLRVSYEDPQPNVRIDPGQSVTAKITIEVMDGAPQGGSINFEVKYTFRQFLP